MKLEEAFHCQVADYLRYALRPGVAWSTFPAGGGGKVRGARLKRMGLHPGWPDIVLIADGQFYGLELKGPKGRVSKAQREAHQQIRNAGGHVSVCHGFDGVEKAIRTWGLNRG